MQIYFYMDLLWAFLAEGPTSKWAVNEDFFPSCWLQHTQVECCSLCAARERGNFSLPDLDVQHPSEVLQ